MNVSAFSIGKIPSIVLATLFIISCATLNKDECKNADWLGIGFDDGSSGTIGSKVDEYRAACAEYGITVNFTLYNKGHAEGLSKYCKPHNGYTLGIGGGIYDGIGGGICVGYLGA